MEKNDIFYCIHRDNENFDGCSVRHQIAFNGRKFVFGRNTTFRGDKVVEDITGEFLIKRDDFILRKIMEKCPICHMENCEDSLCRELIENNGINERKEDREVGAGMEILLEEGYEIG